jgi:hypothetical protein
MDHREQSLDRLAEMTLQMSHNIKVTFRELDRNLVQQSCFEAGRDDGGRYRGRAQTGLDGRAHRFVRWQFQRDSQLAGRYTEISKCRFKYRPRAGPGLSQHPLDFGESFRFRTTNLGPRMFGTNDDHQLVARDMLDRQ